MESKPEFLDLEQVAEALGGIGKFQLLMFVLASLPCLFTAMQTVSFVFTSYQPDYRCRIPTCDVGESPPYHPSEPWIDEIIPSSHGILSQCSTYQYNVTIPAVTSTETCEAVRIGSEELSCSEWVYDLTDFTSTTVTEFNLVCDDEHYKPLLSSLFMIGLLIGAPVWGMVSDKYGRKTGLILSTFLSGVSGTIMAFLPERISYSIFIVICGASNVGVFLTSFVIVLEYVGVEHRTTLGICMSYCFAFGEACVPFLAYFIHGWRILQVVIAAPMCLAVWYYWLIPESTIWLLSQGRWQEAKANIQRAANMNNVDVPQNLMPNERTTIAKEVQEEKISYTEVAKDCLIIRLIAVCAFGWFASSFAFYALSLNSSNLSGNIYLNFLFTALAEVPGYTFLLLTLNRLGRRWTQILCFFLSGIFCIIAGTIPEDPSWLPITMSLLGKMFTSANYGLVYIFTAEIFPTSLRTVAVGTCSLLSRTGSIISPFIANIGAKNELIPFLLCGSVALLAAILSLDLPETNGCKLPETLEDTKELKRMSGGIFSLKRRTSLKQKNTNLQKSAILNAC